MNWMIPYEKLGQDQRDAIEYILAHSDEPVWIQGHAGSGKSVLIVHAIKDYLVKNPKAKVCIVVFTRALVDLFENGLSQIPELTKFNIPVLTIYDDSLKKSHYDAIFADECQDFPPKVIDRLKRASDTLVIAGDIAQSIYSGSLVPQFNQYPAPSYEIESSLNPKIERLRTIYRLTKSVIDIVKNVFPDLLDSMPYTEKEDVDIGLYQAETIEDEVRFCWEEINTGLENRPDEVSAALFIDYRPLIEFVNKILFQEGKPKYIVPHGGPDYEAMNKHLAANDVPIMYVGNGIGSLSEADRDNKLIVMTFHSSKGLDFNYVYVPLISDAFGITGPMKAILLVALTRSKSGLMVTFTGNLHQGMQKFFRQAAVKIKPKISHSNKRTMD